MVLHGRLLRNFMDLSTTKTHTGGSEGLYAVMAESDFIYCVCEGHCDKVTCKDARKIQDDVIHIKVSTYDRLYQFNGYGDDSGDFPNVTVIDFIRDERQKEVQGRSGI